MVAGKVMRNRAAVVSGDGTTVEMMAAGKVVCKLMTMASGEDTTAETTATLATSGKVMCRLTVVASGARGYSNENDSFSSDCESFSSDRQGNSQAYGRGFRRGRNSPGWDIDDGFDAETRTQDTTEGNNDWQEEDESRNRLDADESVMTTSPTSPRRHPSTKRSLQGRRRSPREGRRGNQDGRRQSRQRNRTRKGPPQQLCRP